MSGVEIRLLVALLIPSTHPKALLYFNVGGTDTTNLQTKTHSQIQHITGR